VERVAGARGEGRLEPIVVCLILGFAFVFDNAADTEAIGQQSRIVLDPLASDGGMGFVTGLAQECCSVHGSADVSFFDQPGDFDDEEGGGLGLAAAHDHIGPLDTPGLAGLKTACRDLGVEEAADLVRRKCHEVWHEMPKPGDVRAIFLLRTVPLQLPNVLTQLQYANVHAVEPLVRAIEPLACLGAERGEVCLDTVQSAVDAVQALAGLGEAFAEPLVVSLLLGFEACDALALGAIDLGELLDEGG
jgi:hypothetical protein